MSPLLGALGIALIFVALAGLVSLGMLRWRARRERDLDRRFPPPERSAIEHGVAMAAQASLDTAGRAPHDASALSFARQKREADALGGAHEPLWSNLADNVKRVIEDRSLLRPPR